MTSDKERLRVADTVNILTSLGKTLGEKLESKDERFISVIRRAYQENSWFTEENTLLAFQNWSTSLMNDSAQWLKQYQLMMETDREEKSVGVVNAGNIPLSGLHDLLTILVSGNNYLGKNASNDSILLPYVAALLAETEPSFHDRIQFAERLENMNAVIATGSNNTARYFEYYFGKYPHIIRRNRNGAGVIGGSETKEELGKLGKDIFTYFGLGCRNISKLYVPSGYNFNHFFESIYHYHDNMMSHNRYMNNFDYYHSVLLLKKINFLQNGFLIIREEKQIASPVSILHYETYENKTNLSNELWNNKNDLQCISSKENFGNELDSIRVDFGKAQSPRLWDYADGVDTMKFLLSI